MARFADQRLPGHAVQLKLDCAPSLPPVPVDAERIEQVLVNLLNNALRHTQAGHVTVQAWLDAPQIGRAHV